MAEKTKYSVKINPYDWIDQVYSYVLYKYNIKGTILKEQVYDICLDALIKASKAYNGKSHFLFYSSYYIKSGIARLFRRNNYCGEILKKQILISRFLHFTNHKYDKLSYKIF